MTLHDDKIGRFLDQAFTAGIKDPVRFITDMLPRVYGYLKGAFPRQILPTDVDGEVEINGHFLRLEFKHEDALREGRVPKGQSLCFEALLKTGRFTIFYVGHNERGEPALLWIWDETGRHKIVDPCDTKRLFEACKRWADKYDADKKVTL